MSKLAEKMKVHFATDLNEPVTLHWALSKTNAGEWLVSLLKGIFVVVKWVIG